MSQPNRFFAPFFFASSFFFFLLSLAAPAAQQQTPRPTFRSGVELVTIEVYVVDRDGKPLPALGLNDFEVRVDGRKRLVVSADLVTSQDGAVARAAVAARAAGPDATKPEVPADRVFVIAVDEASFRPADVMMARESARRFIAKLAPSDYVGVFKFPVYEKLLGLSRDRGLAHAAFDRVMGSFNPPRGAFDLEPSEMVDINAGDKMTLDQVDRRECLENVKDNLCRPMIVEEARIFAAIMESDAANRVLGLRLLLARLAEIPHRKMLIVLSGGLMAADTSLGRPDISTLMTRLGRDAAIANTQLYVLHIDDSATELGVRSGNRPQAPDAPPRIARAARDRDLFAGGLEHLAGAANGGYIRVRAGTPDYAFDRVIRETSAYYLVAIAPEDRDRTGRFHFIDVAVKAKGAQVRSRSHVMIPKK